jgi:hypothetical protein
MPDSPARAGQSFMYARPGTRLVPVKMDGKPGTETPDTRSAADVRTGFRPSAGLTRCARPVTDVGVCG